MRPIDRLRMATRAMHLEVEQLVERANLFGTVRGYARFLFAMHRFHQATERGLCSAAARGLAPDWPRNDNHAHLADDLAALGVEPAQPAVPPGLDDAGAVIGWRYVSEGSALGATQLLPRARALGLGPDGTRFLTFHAARRSDWPGFLAALDRRPLDPQELDSMDRAACAGFALVHTSLRMTNDLMEA